MVADSRRGSSDRRTTRHPKEAILRELATTGRGAAATLRGTTSTGAGGAATVPVRAAATTTEEAEGADRTTGADLSGCQEAGGEGQEEAVTAGKAMLLEGG